MAPRALSYASDGGAARICQRGRGGGQSDRAGEGVGREIFWNSCMKTTFSCTIDIIIRGSLCSGIVQFLTLCPPFILFVMNFFQGNIFLFLFFIFPFFFSFLFLLANQGGGGHGPLVHLSYSSNSGAARICHRGPKRGSEAIERGRVWEVGGGFPPSIIIRGSLCSGIDQFPTLFL